MALTAVDGETLFERADGALREGKLAGRGVARLVGADRPRRQRPAPGEAAAAGAAHDRRARRSPSAAELAVVEWSAVFRTSACALSLIDGDALRTIAFCAGLQPQPVTEEPYLIADFPVTAAVLELRQTRQIRSDDLDADPAEIAVMQRNDARTLLIVPLVVGDTVKGLVELYDSRPRVFSTDEQRLALALGRYLAATLERLATRSGPAPRPTLPRSDARAARGRDRPPQARPAPRRGARSSARASTTRAWCVPSRPTRSRRG